MSKKTFSTDELRTFYFSKATNYGVYKTKTDTTSASRERTHNTPPEQQLVMPTPSSSPSVPSPSSVQQTAAVKSAKQQQQQQPQGHRGPSVLKPAAATTSTSPNAAAGTSTSSIATTTTTTTHVNPNSSGLNQAQSLPTIAAAPPVGSGVSAVKAVQLSQSSSAPTTTITTHSNANNNNNMTSLVSNNPTGNSVSPEYVLFLRQQQDLVKMHCGIDEVIAKFAERTQEKHEEHAKAVDLADEVLRRCEMSSNWNWKSKFNREALGKDAGLGVPFSEQKRADDLPSVVELQHQEQQLVKLKQAYCIPNADGVCVGADFKLVLENGIRRFDRLTKEFMSSQMDAAPLVRMSDNLLVQLDHVLSQASLSEILQEINTTISAISQKQKECMNRREQAMEDGVMDVAERETFRLVDLSEELANSIVEKVRLLKKAHEENTVTAAVRDAYVKKANDETGQSEHDAADLKIRCETDLAKLYGLQKQVDDAENIMVERTRHEREVSDTKLHAIQVRQNEAWEQIDSLLKQIRQLETDRYNEVKRRVEDKVKDETRRNEYLKFTEVANVQAVDYDRTIKNCDTLIHCTKLMAEFLQTGFFTIDKRLSQRKADIEAYLLDAEKSHLEIFRSLLFTLGDLEHRKERRIEEISASIQEAHIQQELCNDSLNPNAKRFSDLKKELLRVRDELELELRDIRDRQSSAFEQYKPTEEALVVAQVPHQHPMDELEERKLNTRAKMVEYKAISLGHVSTAPVKSELAALKQSLDDSRKLISRSSNASKTGSQSGNLTAPL